MIEWYNRLIANAELARSSCKSEWGKQYWQSVINTLWRRTKIYYAERRSGNVH